MLRKIILFSLLLVTILVAAYTFNGLSPKEQPVTETESSVATTSGQSFGRDTEESYRRAYQSMKDAAEIETDTQKKAVFLLDSVSYMKKFTADVNAISQEYEEIYNNTDFLADERGLALLKISQQANGNNRYDLLNQFLTPEEQKLSDSEKNYIVNKMIYELTPLAMVYASIKRYEVANGLEFYADDLYDDVSVRVEQDINTLRSSNWLMSLVPDTAMHGATLYALINEDDHLYGVPHEVVVAAFDRALQLNNEVTPNNATKDYIQLETINYLIKIGDIAEANTRVESFLGQQPTNMIRSFIQNGGLTNGRWPHIANNAEILNTLTQALQ